MSYTWCKAVFSFSNRLSTTTFFLFLKQVTRMTDSTDFNLGFEHEIHFLTPQADKFKYTLGVYMGER
jgi:hypothetical protein